VFLIHLLLSSLQHINFTHVDKEISTWLPVSSTDKHNGRHDFHNTNIIKTREKREIDNKPSHIAILYPVDNNSRAGTQRSSKSKRCRDNRRRNGKRKEYRHGHHQKAISKSSYIGNDNDINYYKPLYPSFAAADENRNNAEFTIDDDGVQNVQLTAVPQVAINSFDNNRPKSLASYIKQASASHEPLGEEDYVQQLLTFGNNYNVGNNGFKNQMTDTEKESESNKYEFVEPVTDEKEYINTEHENEWTTKMNPQTYSNQLSDISINPSLQNGFLRPYNIREYHYPYHNMKPNFPLEESMNSKPTLTRNELYEDNFLKPTMYQSHQYGDVQTMNSDPYGNRHENIYWKPEQGNEHQDVHVTYTSFSPVNPELKDNTMPSPNYEFSTTGCTNGYVLNKAIGLNGGKRNKEVFSEMPLYPLSDIRRLKQSKLLSQNGINNAPHVQEPLSNKHRYLPGKYSGVLQEDELLGQSMPDVWGKETSTYHNAIPDMPNQKLKFSPSQDRILKKDSRLTAKNPVLSLPTVSHNIIPSNSHKHTTNFQTDFNEILHNMQRPKVINAITSRNDVPVTSHWFFHKNKTPSSELPYLDEINEMKEDLQFKQNGDGTSPYNSEVPTLENLPKIDYLENNSPYRDEPATYFSSDDSGRNAVLTNIPFQRPTHHMTKTDECSPLSQNTIATSHHYQHISTPSNNNKVGNVASQSQSSTSRIKPQLLYHKPTNYRLTEGINNVKDAIHEEDPFFDSTVISQVTDNSKYRPSTAAPSSNTAARSEILSVPEEIKSVSNSVSSSVSDNSHFILRSDSPVVQSLLKIGRVSGRTKNKFLHRLQNSKNDSYSTLTSAIPSSEQAHLTPAPTSSINMEPRSKSEDTFRKTVNTQENQYLGHIQESLMRIYSAATLPPIVTTNTLRTHPPLSSEMYPQTMIPNEYETEKNMGHDAIPTLQSNGGHEEKTYSTTAESSEKHSNDVSDSTTELPHESMQKSWDKTSDFPESIQSVIYSTTAENEIKEKWKVQNEQPTTVIPNLYEIRKTQDTADSAIDAIDNDPITQGTTEQTSHSATQLLIEKLKSQFGSVPANTTYQPIIRGEVTQEQETNFPFTTMMESLTETSYSHISDPADIMYATAEKQTSITTSNNKNINPEESTVPDKKASAENKGNYDFATAKAALQENKLNTVYISAEPPEILASTQEEISHYFYTTTVIPQQTEVQEMNEKRELNIIQTGVPKGAINYVAKVPTYLKADEQITPREDGAHMREQMSFEDRNEDESDKATAYRTSQNYKQKTSTQKDFQNIFKTETTENYIHTGNMTHEISRDAEETYLHAEHIPIPHETQDTERSMANLEKLITFQSQPQMDGSQYLHTNEYGTTQSALFITSQENFNENKSISAINVESGFENAAVDEWNQKNAQDVNVIKQRNNFHDTNTHQELVTTAYNSDDKAGSEVHYFITPTATTVPPQQKRVTNNYIKLHETELGENTGLLPELLNKEDNLILNEQSVNGNTLSMKMNDHTDYSTLQPVTLETAKPFLNSDTLPSEDILLENIRGMIKRLKVIVTSADTLNKPHEGKVSNQDHNKPQSSDSLQPSVYTRNSLKQMLSEDGINTNTTKTAQMDITTEQTLITYDELYQKLYTETPEAARLFMNEKKTSEGNADLEEDTAQQSHMSEDYIPPVQAYDDLPVTRQNHFDSYNIQPPRETQKFDTTKQNEIENINQAANRYPDLQQDNLIGANENENVEQNTKFQIEDVTHGHEILSPSYIQLVLECNRNSSASTAQIQTQFKNAGSYHSASEQTATPINTSKNYNETSDSVTRYISLLNTLLKIHSDTEGKEHLLHHVPYRYENVTGDLQDNMNCDDIVMKRPNDRADNMPSDETRISINVPPEDVTGITPEFTQPMAIITDSMETMGSYGTENTLQDYQTPEDITRIVTGNEQQLDGVTEDVTEFEPVIMTVSMQNRQTGSGQTEYKQLEEEAADIRKYQQPEAVTAVLQSYEKSDDAIRELTDHKHPEYELKVEYTTENHKVPQSGVAKQTMPAQGGTKRTRNIPDSDITNEVNQFSEDVIRKMNILEKTLMFLLQNKDKIKLLLDIPYSHTMTSVPFTFIGTENQAHLTKEPAEENQEQTEANNLPSSAIKPAGMDYNMKKTANMNDGSLTNIIMDSIKSEGTTYISPSSLGQRKRQTKHSQQIQTVKSESYKTLDTSTDKHALSYKEMQQQPSILRRDYSSDEFTIPSLTEGRSEAAYVMNKNPDQEQDWKAGVRSSDDKWGKGVNLAHLSQMSNTKIGHSPHGPWTCHKNYFCMPAASPTLNQCKALKQHTLFSGNEHINTVPTSSYKMNINSKSAYDYEKDTSLESEEMTQDLFLNLHNQQHNSNNNIKSVQPPSTLSEKEMVMENIFRNNIEENESLPDGSIIDVLDSPQLFRVFYMHNDEKGLQPKLYTKRKSNSHHNTGDTAEESYEQAIKNSAVASRPASLGNWKKYKGSPHETIQPKPSAFERKNYNEPYMQHSSDLNNNERNIKDFPLGFKKIKINKQRYDDKGKTKTSESDKRKQKTFQWEFLRADDRQSSPFRDVHDQSKQYSEYEGSSEEIPTLTSTEVSSRNFNELFDDDISHLSMSDLSDAQEIFNMHTINYKDKLLPEKTQRISQNFYKYSNDCKYPINYYNLSVKDNDQQNNEIHKIFTRCLLQQNNNILQQLEDNNNLKHVYSSGDVQNE
jgi:hypothetical protein